MLKQTPAIGLPTGQGVDMTTLGEEAQRMLRLYRECPQALIPNETRIRWETLTQVHWNWAEAPTPLAAPLPDTRTPAERAPSDPYEFRVCGYPMLSSGLKPLKSKALGEMSVPELAALVVAERERDKARRDEVAHLQAALKGRKAFIRQQSHELRYIRWIVRHGTPDLASTGAALRKFVSEEITRETKHIRANGATPSPLAAQLRVTNAALEETKSDLLKRVRELNGVCDRELKLRQEAEGAATKRLAQLHAANERVSDLERQLKEFSVDDRRELVRWRAAFSSPEIAQARIDALTAALTKRNRELRDLERRHEEVNAELRKVALEANENQTSLVNQCQSAAKAGENAYTRGFNDGRQALYLDVQQLVDAAKPKPPAAPSERNIGVGFSDA